MCSNPFSDITDYIRDITRDIRDTVEEVVEDATRTVDEGVHDVKNTVEELSKDTMNTVNEATRDAQNDLEVDFGGFGGDEPDNDMAADVGDPTGNLTPQESAEAARKRLSRIGRYFTSTQGDTSQVNTGSQRVFS